MSDGGPRMTGTDPTVLVGVFADSTATRLTPLDSSRRVELALPVRFESRLAPGQPVRSRRGARPAATGSPRAKPPRLSGTPCANVIVLGEEPAEDGLPSPLASFDLARSPLPRPAAARRHAARPPIRRLLSGLHTEAGGRGPPRAHRDRARLAGEEHPVWWA